MIKRFFCILPLFIIFLYQKGNAQGTVFQPGDYRDGIYDKENSVNRRFIPYTHLRIGDVQWERRVWREIDLREKINQPLYLPTFPMVTGRPSFFQVLQKAIIEGEIIAFADDEFLIPFEKQDILDKLKKCDSLQESAVNEAGEEIVTSIWSCDSVSIYGQMRSYQLKEDWFFDKQKSVLEVRILGIGAYTYDEAKESPKNIFWVYFPACRPIFAQYEVFNTKNDAERRTYEDIFWKRMFNSKVLKESNVFDRLIQEYSKGIDALLESDRVKQDIFRYEHDLWHL